MNVRKNCSTLDSDEKRKFVDALLVLKSDGTYDRFVQMHVDAMARATPSSVSPMDRNAAHKGPSFLPWHREYLRRFELELQRIDSEITLPYWDWTVDNSSTSIIWQDDFMGGTGNPSNNNRVETGPFAHSSGDWDLSIDGPALRRNIGIMSNRLPTEIEVTNCLATLPYDSTPWDRTSSPSFRNLLEGWIGNGMIHNRVHMWVGGSMTLGSSPNDPVFFLHHCNVDRLWAEWQRLHLSESYLPISGGPEGHNLNDQLFPWDENTTPASVLNFVSAGFTYDTIPGPPPIPDWIRNVARWWSERSISDDEYVNSIQWLIQNNIIRL